jgi:hypothetical protein
LGHVRLWELAPLNGPMSELEQAAQALSACELDAGMNLAPLDAAALQAIWRQLKVGWPERFSTSAEMTIARHEARADDAEHRRQWAAARFHLERLNQLAPGNLQFVERRRCAAAAVKSPRASGKRTSPGTNRSGSAARRTSAMPEGA